MNYLNLKHILFLNLKRENVKKFNIIYYIEESMIQSMTHNSMQYNIRENQSDRWGVIFLQHNDQI